MSLYIVDYISNLSHFHRKTAIPFNKSQKYIHMYRKNPNTPAQKGMIAVYTEI